MSRKEFERVAIPVTDFTDQSVFTGALEIVIAGLGDLNDDVGGERYKTTQNVTAVLKPGEKLSDEELKEMPSGMSFHVMVFRGDELQHQHIHPADKNTPGSEWRLLYALSNGDVHAMQSNDEVTIVTNNGTGGRKVLKHPEGTKKLVDAIPPFKGTFYLVDGKKVHHFGVSVSEDNPGVANPVAMVCSFHPSDSIISGSNPMELNTMTYGYKMPESQPMKIERRGQRLKLPALSDLEKTHLLAEIFSRQHREIWNSGGMAFHPDGTPNIEGITKLAEKVHAAGVEIIAQRFEIPAWMREMKGFER